MPPEVTGDRTGDDTFMCLDFSGLLIWLLAFFYGLGVLIVLIFLLVKSSKIQRR